jgi:hypothetical protein
MYYQYWDVFKSINIESVVPVGTCNNWEVVEIQVSQVIQIFVLTSDCLCHNIEVKFERINVDMVLPVA